MEDILKSRLLEYEKSAFLIDLVKHHSGDLYVSIKQTILDSNLKSEIKINPSVLHDLIFVLNAYEKDIKKDSNENTSSYFLPEKQKKVIERYFKGITIDNLAFQFDCTEEIIEQILLNNDIEIVDNKLPKHRRKY